MKLDKVVNYFKTAGVMCIIACILCFIGGIYVTINQKNFMENAETTMATITNIEKYKTRKGNETKTHYKVEVEYEVDGQRYNTNLNYYIATMREGGQVEIAYDVNNPSNVQDKNNIVGIILCIIGLCMAAIGVPLYIKYFNVAKYRRLKKSGVCKQGYITDVKYVKDFGVNGKYPYQAECGLLGEETESKEIYKSESVMTDITALRGENVNIYIDKKDANKYYVDLDSLYNERF